ncbi:ABC transporter substrate-binding protein [Alicyclobacillus fodiniaquatilis]|uniref:ABC transporter substrate-binding protein n=1 Tax=Alicyclobacillus fodiniaquatilis TaxID=1661150 RepID=A0ABW4JFS8_9BACL
MSTMKKNGSLAVCSLLFLSVVTGCGTSSTKNGQANGDVQLTVWIPSSADQNKVYEHVIDQFNQKYKAQHISAKAQFFTWSDYPEKLSVAMKGGVGPDVLYNGAAATAGLVDAKEVIPLDKYESSDAQVANIIPGFEDQTKYKSHSWFVPVDGSAMLLEYRKDFFQAAHLSPPTTWSALLTDAKKLTIPGKRYGMFLGTSGISLEQTYSEFLYGDGGNFVDPAGQKATVNTPEAVQSMSELQKFFTNGSASVKFVPPAGQDPLGTGKAAMEIQAPNMTSFKQYYPNIYNDIGFAPFPSGPMGKEDNVTYGAANGFYISSESKHPKDAWLLIEAFLSDSGSLARDLGAIPPLQKDQQAAWIEKDPILKSMFTAIGQSKVQGNPNIPQWINVRNTFAQIAQAALYGQNAQSVLAKTNQSVQSVLSQQQ